MSRNDGHFGVEHNAHDAVDHGGRHELMAIDAAIDDQRGCDDCGIVAGLGHQLGLQRDFQSAGNFDKIYVALGKARRFHFFKEAVAALVGDVFMPAGLNEGDAVGSE